MPVLENRYAGVRKPLCRFIILTSKPNPQQAPGAILHGKATRLLFDYLAIVALAPIYRLSTTEEDKIEKRGHTHYSPPNVAIM
jgi:hypothetical protein